MTWLVFFLPARSFVTPSQFSEYGFILGRKRGEKMAVIAGVCFLGATKCLCYLKKCVLWMLLKYTNQLLFLTLPYFDRAVFWMLFRSQIQFYGFWNLSGYFVCCAKPFPIPCTLSAVLPALLFCMWIGNSYTQWIGVPGMVSSVKAALASLHLIRSTQFVSLLFLLAPGMSFKRMQNNHLMPLCPYFQSPDSQLHKEEGVSVCKE